MDEAQMTAALLDVLGTVLRHAVDRNANRASDASWDSIAHMQILFAVEERLGVRFSEQDIPGMQSFDQLLAFVRTHAPAEAQP